MGTEFQLTDKKTSISEGQMVFGRDVYLSGINNNIINLYIKY